MLEVQDIWKNYEGQPLLRGVSFAVSSGETICLLGASGSGKSTLLRIITGLEKAERGSVLWDGQDQQDIPIHRRNFGLMFQDYALFPHRSVAQNVAFGLRMQGLPSLEVSARTREVLELVNMARFASRRVTDLSGGEQQRVALARALAPHPRLLMLDEPLGALDRALKEELAGELRDLLHKAQVPAIYVTHDQQEAFSIADRLILLHRGKVEQEGSPSDVYTEPHSAWVASFLGLSNLLPGRVVSAHPLRAVTELGEFEGMPGKNQFWHADEPVTLLFRPGNCLIGKQGEGDNYLSGVVEDCLFMGQGFRLRLRLKNGQVFSFNVEKMVQPGAQMNLTVEPLGVQFLRGEEGPRG